jgi:hypothetical protein
MKYQMLFQQINNYSRSILVVLTNGNIIQVHSSEKFCALISYIMYNSNLKNLQGKLFFTNTPVYSLIKKK